ncbi:MAG: WD40 repeat domain-containing protein, partial [Cyanobacteria bacterium J06632_22]
LYWLAINRVPVTYNSLQKDIVDLSNREDLLYTLRSLENRSLVDIQQAGEAFTLQPAVMEYVTQHLIRQVSRKLGHLSENNAPLTNSSNELNSHALLKAEASDHVRGLQQKFIVQPIKDELVQQTGSLKAAKTHINALLQNCHQQQHDPTQNGYLVGNLLNLLTQFSQDLKEAVFSETTTLSELTIRQAYLADADLSAAKFHNCRLDKSVFKENLGDVIAVGFGIASALNNTTFLAAGDANGRIHLWNTETFAKYTYWPAHLGWVRSIAFSPDGQWLLSGGDDRALRLWQMPTADLQHMADDQLPAVPVMQWELKRDNWDWVRSVAWHPKGEILACSSGAQVSLYERTTQTLLTTFCATTLRALSPDAAPDFSGSGDDIIRFIQFSPDGQQLASCGDDGHICLWDIASETLIHKFEGHSGWVRSIVFSPDGEWLISGSDDNTVRIWSISAKTCTTILKGHRDRIRAVAISANGRYLASGSDDGTVRLWNFPARQLIDQFQNHTSRVWSVAFFQQEKQLLLASGGDDQSVIVARIVSHESTLQPIKTLRGYANSVRAIALAPVIEGELAVSGGDDGYLKVWKLKQGQPLAQPPARLAGHLGRIWAVAVHPKRRRIATGSDDHSVRLWDLKTGKCLTTLAWHKNWVRAVAFSPDGQFLASAGDDKRIQLWKMPTVEQHHTLEQHRHWVTTLAFSRDSRYLASGSDDRQVMVWDAEQGTRQQVMTHHKHRIRSVAFGPDNLLASASDDCSVAIWKIGQSDPIQVFERAQLGVRSVVFSPDGVNPDDQWLIGGGDNAQVHLWHVGHWEEHYTLDVPIEQGQPFGLQGLSVSADGQRLAGCDRSGAILIWSLKTRQLITHIKARRPYENMEIKNVTGLGPVQKATLRDLGAIDETSQDLTMV